MDTRRPTETERDFFQRQIWMLEKQRDIVIEILKQAAQCRHPSKQLIRVAIHTLKGEKK